MINQAWIASDFVGVAGFVAPDCILTIHLPWLLAWKIDKLKLIGHSNSLICGHYRIVSWSCWHKNGYSEVMGQRNTK